MIYAALILAGLATCIYGVVRRSYLLIAVGIGGMSLALLVPPEVA